MVALGSFTLQRYHAVRDVGFYNGSRSVLSPVSLFTVRIFVLPFLVLPVTLLSLYFSCTRAAVGHDQIHWLNFSLEKRRIQAKFVNFSE